MDVKFDMIPEGQIATKLQTSVASRSGDYDAGVMIWDMIAEYYNRGLIANLDDMIKDPQLPAFDITEFPQPIVNFLNRKGHIVGIPVSVASQIMTYRDDLLKSVNVEVKGAPTWQNIYDWAKATTKDNVVGMTAGWQGGQIYYDNMNILPGDKPFLDQNKRLSIYRDPRLIETWDLLQRMYKEGLMSKDVLNLNVYDGWVKFQQGTVATQPISWPVAVAMLEDPAKSKSAGKIGYCPTPNATPRIGGWSCHIFSDSKNKEATYTFLSWLASPENAAAEVIETGNFDSSYHKSFQTNFDAKYKADLLKRPNGANEIKALAASWDGIKTGRMVDPNTPEVTKFDQVMYPLLARVLTGDLSAKDGLNQAADAAEKILDDAGYYK
jgi:ABC-type glycerol-3-phosphate transport system substrate-binding protein